MTPADQHALREALAQSMYDHDAMHLGPLWTWDQANRKERAEYLERADALIAGPLAPYLAAEAENTRLNETVEAARAALKPFAERGARLPPKRGDYFPIYVKAGDLRVARSVLATIPPKENPDA